MYVEFLCEEAFLKCKGLLSIALKLVNTQEN